ncbi:MAG: YtxH domain-containing protein [Caldilineales bacterium]
MFGTLFRFAAGLVAGAVVGSVSATLLAPASGEQLKSDARGYWQQVKEAGAEAEALRRIELETKFRKVRSL